MSLSIPAGRKFEETFEGTRCVDTQWSKMKQINELIPILKSSHDHIMMFIPLLQKFHLCYYSTLIRLASKQVSRPPHVKLIALCLLESVELKFNSGQCVRARQ